MLFVATHWPRLRIEGPVPRTDLWLHVGAFFVWAVLCGACGWWGMVFSRRNLLGTLIAGVLYASVDEGLQLVPALGRVAAGDDLGGDVAGVLLGVGVLAVVGARGRSR